MDNLRKHGKAPFTVAVIHGGPGAPGSMAPVARELSSDCGILEPLQTMASLDGQVEELKNVLESNGDIPVILIGASWGAWLSYIVAARYPAVVKKLILVGSGGFEKEYGAKTMEIRMSRLSEDERNEVQSLMEAMSNSDDNEKSKHLARVGELFSKTDSYNPISHESDALESGTLEIQDDIFKSVWRDADLLRASGKLLEMGKQIRCPVVAIHGDYDPHPAEGVEKPLSCTLKDFRFILLSNCGHEPWLEKEARDEFYQIVKDELR
jgi:pimeloyl-ACP methyl ester carboxylesterase